MKIRTLVYQLIVVLLLLLATETVAYFVLKGQSKSLPFFLNIHTSEEINSAREIGFDEVHPLWGWNMSSPTLQSKGYEVQNGIVTLHTGTPADTSLRIFITGGSTSDIALNAENWPAALHQLLIDSNIPHVMYVAAVGGFNSAQEYLRLIETGIELKPHVHISYSGANETGDYGFVTEYEKDFYNRAVSERTSTFVLPNTVFAIRQMLGVKETVAVAELTEHATATRFEKNLKLMKASADCFGYKYIGILQPLNGIGDYRQQKNTHQNAGYLEDYKKYYPAMQKFVQTGDSAFYDFTGIFDTATAAVYIDDCHLQAPYQKVVAREVFKTMKKQ